MRTVVLLQRRQHFRGLGYLWQDMTIPELEPRTDAIAHIAEGIRRAGQAGVFRAVTLRGEIYEINAVETPRVEVTTTRIND